MDDVEMDDVSVVREFIARINAADVEGLGRLMAPDHTLEVFDEAPFVEGDENIEAWHGYAGSWPSYHIYEARDRPTRESGSQWSVTRPARTSSFPTTRRTSSPSSGSPM